MAYLRRRDAFLKGFSEDAPELRFYIATFKLLEALAPPITYHYGLACIKVLHLTTITLADGYTIGDDSIYMGSIEDCANVVAVVFVEINPDPIWWKASYPVDGFTEEVSVAVRELIGKIKQLSIVTSLQGYGV